MVYKFYQEKKGGSVTMCKIKRYQVQTSFIYLKYMEFGCARIEHTFDASPIGSCEIVIGQSDKKCPSLPQPPQGRDLACCAGEIPVGAE